MIFMKYDFAAVEKKWQDIWETENTFAASNDYTKMCIRDRENMLRLRDILSELENRVEPLRKEAEKAREYLSLAEERRTLEIGVWLAKIDRLSAQYREIQDRFLAARGEYDSLTREEEGLEERINLLYTQMQDCAVSADGLRTRCV